MTLINTIPPEKAEDAIKKGYDHFTERGVDVPDPLRLYSASPGLFDLMIKRNQYYANHPNLSFALLAHIRFFVATKLAYPFCRTHNKKLLLMQGVEETEFEKMGMDPDKSMLEETEKKMAAFVLRAMDAPESIDKKDIDILHEAGWEDRDIFDALAQGVGMIDHNIFMNVFKVAF